MTDVVDAIEKAVALLRTNGKSMEMIRLLETARREIVRDREQLEEYQKIARRGYQAIDRCLDILEDAWMEVDIL